MQGGQHGPAKSHRRPLPPPVWLLRPRRLGNSSSASPTAGVARCRWGKGRCHHRSYRRGGRRAELALPSKAFGLHVQTPKDVCRGLCDVRR